jgi:4-hydroxybenzoate polyprenyltransferase
MSTARELLLTVRPKQWTKNLLVFAPVIFAGELRDLRAVALSVGAFVVLCIVSGIVYIMNDIRDVERDREHVKKRERPIAAGRLSVRTAVTALFVLVPVAAAAAIALGVEFALVVAAYLVLQIAYTMYLKNQVILDVMTIAAGFVLRAVAGAVVIGSYGSPWLYAAAALLALFLGFGKRRHELVELGDGAAGHRFVLTEYSSALLDALLATVTSATIVTYAIYTFFSSTAQHAPHLMLTVPFVVYGLFRYLYLIHTKNLGGSPEEILLTDKPLIACILLYLLAVGAALYFPVLL